jgi:phosphinothricin acetyltransferase
MAVYPWLVLVVNQEVKGYAFASVFRSKPAYQWSPESTIYLAPEMHGMKIGKLLYTTLFDILRFQGFYNVFAGVAMPNKGSEKLHLSCGFTGIGEYKNIGYKTGDWHSTRWFQLCLQEYKNPPQKPLPFDTISTHTDISHILETANQELRVITLNLYNTFIP